MYTYSSTFNARKRMEFTGKGLASVNGAANIIDAISIRKVVTHLNLGHNPLGDDGCETLFAWLCSPPGQKYVIQIIHLNVCNIGDRGLYAIGQYLRNNRGVKELWLQSNRFSGDANIVTSFVEGVNSSQLELLSLSSSHPHLITQVLQQINAPFLREFQCSMSSLSQHCAPSLISYVTSPRCQLNILKANANSIGLRAVRDLVDSVEHANYGLLQLDLYMNGSEDGDLPEDIQDRDNVFQHLKELMLRNATMKRATESEALILLRHSRPLLFRFPRPLVHTGRPQPYHSFFGLPTELQLQILSFCAPILSSMQRIRIFNYASNPETLPQLLPSLVNARTSFPDLPKLELPGLASPAFVGAGLPDYYTGTAGVTTSYSREEERKRWLVSVGCDRFQPESVHFSSIGGERTEGT